MKDYTSVLKVALIGGVILVFIIAIIWVIIASQ